MNKRCAVTPAILLVLAGSTRAFGGVPFPAQFHLSTLLPANGGNGSNGFVLNGIDAGDESGLSVSSAGDVNSDGVADLIIGAHRADPNGNSNAGESYVVFGGEPSPPSCPGDANGDGVVNFDDITATLANWLNTCP